MGSVWARRRNRCVVRRRGLRGGVLCVKGVEREGGGGFERGG